MLVAALLAVGCSEGTTSQGTLYTVNISQELEAFVPASLEKVHAAAVKSIEQMGYTTTTNAIDVREAIIEGKTALKKPVHVKLFKVGENVTKVLVHVGGDEQASKDLLDKIETGST